MREDGFEEDFDEFESRIYGEYLNDIYLYDYHNDFLITSTTSNDILVAYNLFNKSLFKVERIK